MEVYESASVAFIELRPDSASPLGLLTGTPDTVQFHSIPVKLDYVDSCAEVAKCEGVRESA